MKKEKNPYKCDICGKGFGYKTSLDAHHNKHTRLIQYKCDICGKTLKNQSGLKRHKKRNHTGEKS
ncbi:C2H2-type zinc finger protein [Cardinium endosymbiont of Sogatella furcifera]|uniref:C2H2-type zinc finger protein n=1 Tax=Cardinium endosymbiont of Sogatella furcifera TaxID=650378 RepID=UPI003B968228